MRNRAGLTWIVVWVWVAQLLLAGPAPALALSPSSPAVSTSALGLADLGVVSVDKTPWVLPSHYFFSVEDRLALSSIASSFALPAMPAPDAAVLRLGAQAALKAKGKDGPDGPAVLTDERGFYRFQGLPSGTHKVTLDVQTLPGELAPGPEQDTIVLWVTPGMEQVSEAFSSGVRFTVNYDLDSGDLSGYVFVDLDGDGQMDEAEPGLPGVRVVDPTLHQYFVPFDDNHLWELFVRKAQCHSPTHLPCTPMASSVFLTTGSDGTVFFYDHWEDGYDPDPTNPEAGSTTVVEVLDAGATRIFASDIDPAEIGSLDLLYYDGRDRITIVGEDANVIRLVNASGYDQGNGFCIPDRRSGWLAAAWEVAEVAEWGQEYHAIVGEDLALGLGGQIQDHNFAGMEVMAWQDGTLLSYNEGAPIELNAGQTFYVAGENGGAAGSGVKSGDLITATKPVQVQMMTGSCNDVEKIVSAHGYTLIPRRSWGSAYWAPVPGFDRTEYCALDDGQWDTANPQIDTDIYLHNQDDAEEAIQVLVQSGDLAETITIPPNETVSVLAETGWPDLAVDNVGTYLTSDQDFWGLVVVDSATSGSSGSDDFDWGYSLVPESELSSQAVIGYGPGRMFENDDPDAQRNGNVAFVVAVVTTTVYVDLNQDGLPDPFDMDGDSELNTLDAWGEPAWDEPTSALGVEVGAGQVLRVADAFDDRLRGARIYTEDLDEHIAVAWGQDPCSAFYLLYLDLGYTVLSSPVPRLSKEATLAVDADVTQDISPGDIVTYTMVLDNNGQSDMNEVWLTDTLPYTDSEFLRASLRISYPPPTSTVEYLDGGLWGTSPVAGAQAFRVHWPTIAAGQKVTLTFRSRILVDTPASELVNETVVKSANTSPVMAEARTSVVRPVLALSKLVDRPIVSRGDPFTYTIIVSNTDAHAGAAVGARVWDVLPPGISYVPGTLRVQWPEEVVWYESISVPHTTFFHGVYADDFDLDPSSSTGYSGSDGSLAWGSDWIEVGESDDSDLGSLQVLVDGPNSLSAPAYLWMGDLAGVGEAGLTRDLDLSDYVSPTVRLHRAGSSGVVGEYYLTVDGALLDGSRESHDGEYGAREFILSDGYGPVTLGLMVDGMAAGDAYRFDHISVYEKQPVRQGITDLSQRYSRLDPRSVDGIGPVSYDPTSRNIVITDSLRLPAQGVMTVTMSVVLDQSVDITQTMYLTNTGYVRAQNRPQTITDTAVVSVPANTADLAIVKMDDPDRVIKANDRTLTYTLVYTNYGPVEAQNVTLTDTLPAEVTFEGVVSQSPDWTGPAVGTGTPVVLTWTTPTLAVGQTGEIVFTVIVTDGFAGVLTNYAGISTETPESRYDNNQDQEETEVDTFADVTIQKSGEPDVVSVGDQLVYTLAYTNNGPDPALDVVVSDTLIPEIEYVDASPAPIPPTDTVLRWELGTLLAGQGGTIVMTTTVTASAVDTFTNTVQISTTTPETDYDNNEDTDPTDVTANVAIVKSGDPDLVTPGDTLVYTLMYTNQGPAAAENVVVSDTLIPEISFVSAEPAPSQSVGEVLYWDLGVLDSGASGSIVVTTTVTAEARGAFTNTAEIATTTPESRYDDNVDDDPTDVALADVALQKTVSHRVAAPGESLIYTLTYQNLGSIPALDVVVIDELPDEIIFDRAEPVPDVTTNPLRWNVGRMEVGETGTILVYAHVRADLEEGAHVRNFAEIETSTEESDYTNNQDSAPTPVELIDFTAWYVPEVVILEWETTWEVRTYGFKLYRGETSFLGDASPIAFIFAAGHGSSGGARYGYKDLGVDHGQTYYYWLGDVDFDGRETYHGPVKVITLPKLTDFDSFWLSRVPWIGDLGNREFEK